MKNEEYDVVIVGAGVAGAMAASTLRGAGLKVVVVDKARGTGGRLSSKRLKDFGEDSTLPLGCQSFKLKSGAVQHLAYGWSRQQVVMAYDVPGFSGKVYSSLPRTSALTRHLLHDVDLKLSTRVNGIAFSEGVWQLKIEDSEETIEGRHIILATPPQQAADLLPAGHPMIDSLEEVEMLPQWVTIFKVEVDMLGSGKDALKSIIDRLADNPNLESINYFPDSSDGHRGYIVVHACREWSYRNHQLEKQLVAAEMLNWISDSLNEELERFDSKARASLVIAHVHRWLYAHALPSSKLEMPFYSGLAHESGNPKKWSGISLCGDYFRPSPVVEEGVETAILSGERLALDIIYEVMPVIQPA